MSEKVSLVRCQANNEVKRGVFEALSQIDINSHSVKNVVIKPNLCYYWNASTGYTTDPVIVSALIDWVREKYGEHLDITIAEADGSAMRTKLAFKILGYEKLAKDKGVGLYNLSDGPCVQEKTTVNRREMEFKVPKLLHETDLFINVPKLKIMQITRITCAMKNIFGCIATPRKVIYHPYLNEAVVGINKLLKPQITLVDGLVGLGKYPVKLNLLMASRDPFSTDWIASQIMGFNPSSLDFLRIAETEKIGDHRQIRTVGEQINTFQKLFPKSGLIPTEYVWGLEIGLLRLYARIVGDVLPPFIRD
ncbi:MAG: DUF362 domain-containing protein [Candidatus Bathyarchaeota archaeon]|nr:DUF362 domain-containing protein [Candidatus Bathyarchaeota archaeon]